MCWVKHNGSRGTCASVGIAESFLTYIAYQTDSEVFPNFVSWVFNEIILILCTSHFLLFCTVTKCFKDFIITRFQRL